MVGRDAPRLLRPYAERIDPRELPTCYWSWRKATELGVYPLSQPIPSSSASNRCGSGASTVNFRYGMSPQSRSGGAGRMQTVGYAGSQLACGGCVVVRAGLGRRVVTLGFGAALVTGG